MNKGMNGIERFWAGWMIVLVTYYLGGLDTGFWLPSVLTGIEILAFILMLTGIRPFSEKHKNFKTAAAITAVAFAISIGAESVQLFSLGGITDWMAIAAICLAATGDILFVVLTGLVLLGHCALIRLDGNEKAANRLGYLWALFLTFTVLYMAIQAAAILLVNEGLEALTYAVPATGIPMLIIGLIIVVNLYRSHLAQTQQEQ